MLWSTWVDVAVGHFQPSSGPFNRLPSAASSLLLVLSYRRASGGFQAGKVFMVSSMSKPNFPGLNSEPRVVGEDRRLAFISVTDDSL